MEKYNGWENYTTWVTKLWLDNSQAEQEYWETRAKVLIRKYGTYEAKYTLSTELKDYIQECNPIQEPNLYSDLMGYAIDSVNYYEIAESYIDFIEDD